MATAMAEHVITTIRYDGPALAGHEMDVQDLAPALLALAEMVQIANRKFNGDRASIRVLVNADVEQKCFQLDLSLIQSWLDHAQVLFGRENVATAKQIAELIGLAAPGVGGLFWLYKKLRGQPDAGTTLTINKGGDTTIIMMGDGTPITIDARVVDLASDPEMMKRAKAVLRPLERPGYEDFTVLNGDQPVVRIDKAEAKAIIASPPLDLPAEDGEDVLGDDTVAVGPAWVDTSHFRGQAKWLLLWSGQRVDAKMPDEFLRQFQENEILVIPNTKLTVRMRISTPIDERGMPAGPVSFTVEEVMKIELPPKAPVQTKLFD